VRGGECGDLLAPQIEVDTRLGYLCAKYAPFNKRPRRWGKQHLYLHTSMFLLFLLTSWFPTTVHRMQHKVQAKAVFQVTPLFDFHNSSSDQEIVVPAI
jgi:hypothetical protein